MRVESGEVVVCGRIKDVIIMAGRNIFPTDIERAACRVSGVFLCMVVLRTVFSHKTFSHKTFLHMARTPWPCPLSIARQGRASAPLWGVRSMRRLQECPDHEPSR